MPPLYICGYMFRVRWLILTLWGSTTELDSTKCHSEYSIFLHKVKNIPWENVCKRKHFLRFIMKKKEWHFSPWSVVQTSDRSDGDKTTKTCGPYLTEKLALCVYFPKALHYYHPLYTIRPPQSVVHWTSSNDTFFAYFLVTKRSILQHCIGCWMLLLASLAKKYCQNDNALLLAKEFQVRSQFDTKNISLQEFQPNTRSRVHSTFEKIKITIRLTNWQNH